MKNQKTNEKGLVDLSRTVLTKTDVDHLIDKGELNLRLKSCVFVSL